MTNRKHHRTQRGFYVAPILAMAVHPRGRCVSAQNANDGKKQEAAPKPSAPAPKRDLSGVWMRRSPASMRGFTGATFTKEEPELTEWGKQKYAEAKNSNGGKFTLATTNDPVLTRCAPPGTPRVYFHPYPFEFVNAGKEWLQIFEYDHTIRRMYADGRPVPTDPDLTWMGTSVGHWEGDTTFVVETVGLNDANLDRPSGPPAQHGTACNGALPPRGRRTPADRFQDGRSQVPGEAVDIHLLLRAAPPVGNGRNFLLRRLSRLQQV